MATGGATGFVLHIDDELINKLNTADQKIQDLAKHSEESRDRPAAHKRHGPRPESQKATEKTLTS